MADVLDLTDDQKRLVSRVTERKSRFEQSIGREYRERCDHFYGLYRAYSGLRSSLRGVTDRRDRDDRVRGTRSTFGADLHIPYIFSVIETVVPRVLSNDPKVLILPREGAAEDSSYNMKCVVDTQQSAMNYAVRLQKTAKSGLMYGLGVQKLRWRFEERQSMSLVRRPIRMPGQPEWRPKIGRQVRWDDPWVEGIDPRDFFWEPTAGDLDSCGWAIHRSWREPDYVVSMLRSGQWTGLDPAKVDQIGPSSPDAFSSTWSERMRAQGFSGFDTRGQQLHEVWEFHDGEQVITVLDGQVPVVSGPNPYWHGELPFSVYRPSILEGEMIGVGMVEVMEHLQREMDTLRSQRRDNATVVLQQPFAYQDGLVEASDLRLGPAQAIPTLADPREVIMPIKFGDIPNSGYQEELAIKADIERVTGIDDSSQGVGGGDQTATGVQLVQAAANVRTQNMTKLLASEVIKRTGRQWVALNQQRIVNARDVRVPYTPEPGEEPTRMWAWKRMGPAELAGQMAFEVDGGALPPENVPQMRQDANLKVMVMGSPLGQMLDPRKMAESILKDMGIKNPEGYIAAQQEQVPADVVHRIAGILQERLGLDPQAAQAIIGQALDEGTADAQDAQGDQGGDQGAPPPDGPQDQPNGNGPAMAGATGY